MQNPRLCGWRYDRNGQSPIYCLASGLAAFLGAFLAEDFLAAAGLATLAVDFLALTGLFFSAAFLATGLAFFVDVFLVTVAFLATGAFLVDVFCKERII
jgi:hypothetical protein